jgi:hypothetical protein
MAFKMRGHTLPGFKQKDVLTASNVNNIKIKSQSDDAARAEMSRLDGEIKNATTPEARDSLGNLHTAASLGLSSSFINNPNSRKPSGLQQSTGDNAGKDNEDGQADADDGTNYLRPGPSLGELEELQFQAYTAGDTAKANYFGREFADLKAQLVKDGKMNTKDKGKSSPTFGGGYGDDPNVKGGY